MVENQGSGARRRLTRAESRARTRQLLLDAAADVFAEKGYTGASVEEIADRAGYSIGAVYSNFEGKQQLFLELLSTRAESRIADAAQVLKDSEDAPGFRSGLGRLLTDTADQDIEFESLHAEFWLYAVRNPEAMAMLASRLQEARTGLEQLLEESLSERGESAAKPVHPLATIVFALFHGLVQQRRIDPESVPEDLFDQALSWLFAGWRADRF
ncbi:helix-turn-helix domain-containing protein [Streptomyces sp. NPDC006284]|uniref:TetR/AcrR family transcriptional regulator n=1 Tax=Streptomyces sp. NPDC006284 TaxID=3156742 RepID=UPI0033BD742C